VEHVFKPFYSLSTELSDATDVTPINTGRSPRAEPLPDFGGHSPIRSQQPPVDTSDLEERPHGRKFYDELNSA